MQGVLCQLSPIGIVHFEPSNVFLKPPEGSPSATILRKRRSSRLEIARVVLRVLFCVAGHHNSHINMRFRYGLNLLPMCLVQIMLAEAISTHGEHFTAKKGRDCRRWHFYISYTLLCRYNCRRSVDSFAHIETEEDCR